MAIAADVLLIHTNDTAVPDYDDRMAGLRGYGKPILVTEDPKTGSTGAAAAATAVSLVGFFLRANQAFPFTFAGVADDPVVYDAIRTLTTSR